MVRKFFLLILFLPLALGVCAQQEQQPAKKKFSPEQFDAELYQYITTEACLTPQESSAFFPIYKEMQKKQRAIFERQKLQGRIKPADEKGCEKYIKNRDEIELEQKRIQQTYHNKFLSVLSASKLYDVIKAEDRFYRQKMKSWGHGQKPQQKKK